MSLYGSGLFVLSSSPAGGQLSPTVWTLVVIGSATTVIVDRKVKRSFFGFFCFESFCCRAVAGFLAGVKASHHSTDKESRDRLDLGVGCHQVELWKYVESSQKHKNGGNFQLLNAYFDKPILATKRFFQVPGFTLPFNIVGWIVWAVLLRS